MASVNVDLVRSIYAAWERGDFSSTVWAHANIEYVTADGPAPTARTGVAGMAEMTRDWMSVWQGWRVEADEYLELDHERVLVLLRWSGCGRTSGLEIGQLRAEGLSLFQVRGSKVTRLIFYLDRERGLADLGLAPDGRSADL